MLKRIRQWRDRDRMSRTEQLVQQRVQDRLGMPVGDVTAWKVAAVLSAIGKATNPDQFAKRLLSSPSIGIAPHIAAELWLREHGIRFTPVTRPPVGVRPPCPDYAITPTADLITMWRIAEGERWIDRYDIADALYDRLGGRVEGRSTHGTSAGWRPHQFDASDPYSECAECESVDVWLDDLNTLVREFAISAATPEHIADTYRRWADDGETVTAEQDIARIAGMQRLWGGGSAGAVSAEMPHAGQCGGITTDHVALWTTGKLSEEEMSRLLVTHGRHAKAGCADTVHRVLDGILYPQERDIAEAARDEATVLDLTLALDPAAAHVELLAAALGFDLTPEQACTVGNERAQGRSWQESFEAVFGPLGDEPGPSADAGLSRGLEHRRG